MYWLSYYYCLNVSILIYLFLLKKFIFFIGSISMLLKLFFIVFVKYNFFEIFIYIYLNL